MVLNKYKIAIMSLLYSGLAQAWSQASYDLIFLEASKSEKSYAHNLGGKEIHFIENRNLIYQDAKQVKKVFTAYDRTMPKDLKTIITDSNSTYITFPYYRGKGFGKRVGQGYLTESVKYLMDSAKSEKNKDIQAVFALYASYYLAKMYNPNNIVGFFDRHDYSRGDGNGREYCISISGKLNNAGRLINCRMTMATYWQTALVAPLQPVDVAQSVPYNESDVVSDTSKIGPYMYSAQPFRAINTNYRQYTQATLKSQAHKAGLALNFFWYELYKE